MYPIVPWRNPGGPIFIMGRKSASQDPFEGPFWPQESPLIYGIVAKAKTGLLNIQKGQKIDNVENVQEACKIFEYYRVPLFDPVQSIIGPCALQSPLKDQGWSWTLWGFGRVSLESSNIPCGVQNVKIKLKQRIFQVVTLSSPKAFS